MPESFDSLWKTTLAFVQPEVSEGNYFALFKQTSLLSIDNNIATIAAPSSILISLIQRHTEIIKKALIAQGQHVEKIVFVPKTIDIQGKKVTDEPLFARPVQKPLTTGHLPRVKSDYTFATLAVSQSNQLAFVSAQNVAEHPGRSYNPLFIYGPVGVGKTHLMQAIANEVYTKTPDTKIVYITSEEFTNEVVQAIRNNDTAQMKKKFRSASLLIIDDVQFIAGKDRVEEELFHTFNSLIDSGGQIVLSSDRPPNEIKKLEARLSSRFSGGLTVDIEPPDFEMRTAIVLKKSDKFGFSLPIDIAKIIAEKEQDVRGLEGALLRVITESKTKGVDISLVLAERVLNNKPARALLHSEDIIDTVCAFYDIKPTQLKGPKREASLVKARQIAMYILKKELSLSLVEIGNIIGGRDHTTIMYGIEKIESLNVEKTRISEEIVRISKKLHE